MPNNPSAENAPRKGGQPGLPGDGSTGDPLAESEAGEGGHRNGKLIRILGMGSSVGSSFAVFGLQACHAILLARLLGPIGRGEYATAMFYTQTMLYTGLLGTLYSIARAAAVERDNYQLLQRTALRCGLLTGVLSLVAAIAMSVIGVPSDKTHVLPWCCLCACMLPLEHMRLASQAVDHGRGAFNRYNISRVFAAAVFPAFVLLLTLGSIRSLGLVATLTVSSSAVALGFFFLISDNRDWFGPRKPPVFSLIKDGRSDAVAVFAGDLFDRLGNFLLLWMVSLEDYGFYVTAVPAATMLLVAPHTFALYSFRSAKELSTGGVTRLIQLACAALGFQAICLAMLLAILQPLLGFLFGEEFQGILGLAQVLTVAMAANGCALVGDGFLRGINRASYGVWTRIVAAAVMLLCSFALPVETMLLRIAYAMTAGYVVNAVLTMLACIRETYLHSRELPVVD